MRIDEEMSVAFRCKAGGGRLRTEATATHSDESCGFWLEKEES